MNTDNLNASYVDGFDNVNKQLDIYETWTSYTQEIINESRWIGPSKTSAYVISNFDSDIEIADLACGPGPVGALLNIALYKNVDGYDIIPSFLEKAKDFYRSVDYCNILETPFPKKYPVIIASGVFTKGHLSSAPAKNIANSLTDDGILVMTTPDMQDYDYMQESGWNDQMYLKEVKVIGPWKSLQTQGHQHYHFLRIYKKQ